MRAANLRAIGVYRASGGAGRKAGKLIATLRQVHECVCVCVCVCAVQHLRWHYCNPPSSIIVDFALNLRWRPPPEIRAELGAQIATSNLITLSLQLEP